MRSRSATMGLILVLLAPALVVPAAAGKQCMGRRVTVSGTGDNNSIYGTPHDDVIHAGNGVDMIHALEGDDVICAGLQDDRIEAGPGDDIVSAGGGADAIWGFAGDDRLIGGNHDDYILGFDGADVIEGGPGTDFLRGDSGDDRVDGGPGKDIAGFELVERAVRVDLARDSATGQGSDRLPSIEGLIGSSKGDRVLGDGRSNVITGMAGDDVLRARGGIDAAAHAFLGQGVTADLKAETARGQGDDVVAEFEALIGSPEDDVLRGDARPNFLNGAGGDKDKVIGLGGNDVLRVSGFFSKMSGGPGNDILKAGRYGIADYSRSPRPVVVDIDGHVVTGEGTDRLVGVVSAIGSRFADTMTAAAEGGSFLGGGPGPDVLTGGENRDAMNGGAGDDRLEGRGVGDGLLGDGGNDLIHGGDGDDSLWGGGGDDELFGEEDNDLMGGDKGGRTNEGDVGFGDDLIDAGSGNANRLWLTESPVGQRVDLGAGTATGEGEDRIIGIDLVVGSDFDDYIVGTEGPDNIDGGTGDDEIYGLGGDDWLEAFDGNDTVDGGAETDTCLNAETTTSCEQGGGTDRAGPSSPSRAIPGAPRPLGDARSASSPRAPCPCPPRCLARRNAECGHRALPLPPSLVRWMRRLSA